MIQNAVWGPALWKILHRLAECLGYQGVPLLELDEQRAWIRLLNKVEKALPCPMCRKHQHAQRALHPVEQFLQVKGEAFREAARRWLQNLHERVNQSRGIESTLDLSGVETLQADRTTLPGDISNQLNLMRDCVMYRQILPESLKEFREALLFMKKFEGVSRAPRR